MARKAHDVPPAPAPASTPAPVPTPELKPRRRKAKDAEPRPIALAIRGRVEWKGWVARLAEADRTSLNELVDRALARYAREIGFKEGPPER